MATPPDNTPYPIPRRFGAGFVIGPSTNAVFVVPVLGAGRIRIVSLLSAAGTLVPIWGLADGVGTQATNPPVAATPIVGGTELTVDIPINQGYAYLILVIVNGAAPSTISYIDVFQTKRAH